MKVKFLLTALFFVILFANRSFAQAPTISYAGSQAYIVGSTITPLTPTNTGGAVPATVYGQVTTFAGTGTFGSANGTGTSASFGNYLGGPLNVATDVSGNVYVADYQNTLIRKITPAGAVTTLAGGGPGLNTNGTGTGASFYNPQGVAVDGLGNVYVADAGNHNVRKITPGGVVTTYAGSGALGYTDGPAATAVFSTPVGVAVDASGNVFVADGGNYVIRKITPGGTVSTFAGSGSQGSADGTGTAASFYSPIGVATDANGNVYVDDYSGKIRKITPAGVVTTLAGNGGNGFADGTGTSAKFYSPSAVTADAQGNIFVADKQNNRIRKISPAGVVTTLAGTQAASAINGVGTAAGFYQPTGVAADGFGNLYVADWGNYVIRKISITGYTISPALPAGLTFDATTGTISGTPTATAGTATYTITGYNIGGSSSTTINITVNSAPVNIYTIAGNGSATFSGDGGSALVAGITAPYATVIDKTNNIVYMATSDNRIRKILLNQGGLISTIAGTGVSGYSGDGGQAKSAQLKYTLVGLALDPTGTKLYVGEFDDNRIRKIDLSSGIITTIAGTGVSGFSGDGAAATAAKLSGPEGIAVDGSGNIYFTDANNGRVRKIDASTQVITTVAGGGTKTGVQNGIAATALSLGFVERIAYDQNRGKLYIADESQNILYKIDVGTQTVTTAAGTGASSYTGDSGPATSATFSALLDVYVDQIPGDIYLTDQNSNVVRKINGTSQYISTYAGKGTKGYSGDGGLATLAQFNFLTDVAMDNNGYLYVDDYSNNVIRQVGGTPLNGTSLYFSNSSGDLSSLSTYGINADGTGTNPTDFNGSGVNATYQLANRSSYALTTALTVGSTLNIPSGATLDLHGNGLTLKKLSGTGTLTGSYTSSLTVNGTISGLAFATGKEQLKTLTLGSSASLTLASFLAIASTGTVTLGANATLNTNNTLSLRSDISGTGQIAALGAGASITGGVTVERYLADKRAWRLISPSVYSVQTINAAWQEGAGGGGLTNPNPGYGTFIIGNSTANGFDISNTSGSLLSYNGTAFSSVANTNSTLLNAYPAYFLFSIGNRGVNPVTAGVHSSTTLHSYGSVVTGTQPATVNAAGYTLVGNPYPAPVDFSQVSRSATVPNQFYTWDINLGTYGGYVLVSYNGGSYTEVPSSPSGLTNIIPEGAAIFVQSDGSTTGTLTLNESSKATGTGSNTFSNFATANTVAASNQHNLRVNLTDSNLNLIDGVMTSFANGYSNKVDNNDAKKLPNFYENIALARAGSLLTLERRSDIASKDTIYLQLSGTRATSYQLQIDPADFNEPNMTASLEDAYLHTSTKLDLTQVSNIAFSSSADTATYKNRFRITFSPTLNTVMIKTPAEGARVIAYPNPATGKQINLTFDGMPLGSYNITVSNTFGQIMQKSSMVYNGSTSNKSLSADYTTGVYTVNIQSASYNQSIKVIVR